MKRRANGEGAVYQRADGRWECRVVLPSGERKSLYGQSQKEVLEKRKAELDRAQAGMPAVSERQTVAAYLATWLEGKKTRIRPSTWKRYEIHVRADVTPELARLQVAQLSAAHVQRLYATHLAAGKSAMTVRHLHAVLGKAFADAAKWGIVLRNVVALVDPPKAKRHEMQALDERQVRALLDSAVGDPHEALYVLAVTTGMRQGELFGLRWQDVDLEKRMLQVRQTINWATGSALVSEPKTEKSRRRVELSALAVEALTTHRRRQKEARIAHASAWKERGLVFTNVIGGPLHPSNFTAHSYRPLLRRAGLPQIRFHDLRHTAASIPLAHGVPTKIISEMLGHSSTAITDDIYSHVTPTMQRGVSDLMDAVLGARPETSAAGGTR